MLHRPVSPGSSGRLATLVAVLGLGATAASAQNFVTITDPANPIVAATALGSYTGCAWVDVDDDGLLDLFVVRKQQIFRNLGGGTFDLAAGAVPNQGQGVIGTTWSDFDNDGDIDCYLIGSQFTDKGSMLYRNDGNFLFTRILDGDIGDAFFNTGWGGAFADIDNDAYTDIVVAAANGFGGVTHVNRLLHNNGDGSFSHLNTTPITDSLDAYTIPTWSDYDLDGDVDLFIGSGEISQLDEDNLYRNRLVEGSPLEFERITTAPIATDLLDGQVWNWIDYDNDRDLDGFITNYNGSLANKLYRNDAGTYVAMTGADVGTIVTDSNQGLGNLWADFDNDGDLDCLVTNDNAPTNDYFVNDGDGTFTQNFVEPFVTSAGPHYGSTAGDYDNDGDLDLYVHGTTTSKGLYRNDLANGNSWLNVKLVGAGAPGGSNVSALGAKVQAKATIDGNAVWQFREISAQNTFSSMNMLNAHFGLGDAATIDTLLVTWPSGIVEVLENVTANQFLVVNETVGPTDASLVGNPSRNEIVLGRAVPNPTRAGAAIEFEIAREQSVSLSIFDVAGRHVRTLADGAFGAGRHQVTWDGRDEAGRTASSGVYFYRLRAQGSAVEISDRLVLRR